MGLMSRDLWSLYLLCGLQVLPLAGQGLLSCNDPSPRRSQRDHTAGIFLGCIWPMSKKTGYGGGGGGHIFTG